MAKKQDINSLIEAQDEDLKSSSLARLRNRLAENDEDISQPNQNLLVKKAFLNKRNIVIFSVAFLLISAGILLPVLLRKNEPLNEFRYCSDSDYYIDSSDQSIAQYATANEKSILYFDTEEKYEILVSQQYKLNTTNEIICFYEELSAEDYIIAMYITDNYTELDFSKIFTDICSLKTQTQTVEIIYGADTENSYAKFEYNGYIYYLKALGNTNYDYVLSLVDELIDVK